MNIRRIIPSSTGPTKPQTLRIELGNAHLKRPIVFDPALRNFTAHRGGEPVFQSEDEASIWYSNRMAVLHHMLLVVSQSRWREHLLLRGSGLMASWFGELARRPGDLDWVVTPSNWKMDSKESRQLISDIVSGIESASIRDEISIQRNSHVIEEIWTYERAPGLRVVIPWQHSDQRNNGTVQMDFVFGEKMPTVPVTTPVSIGGLPPVSLQTASPQQSLAWKLLWLATDSYAMGKDLYDAVLLAEKFGVTGDILRATFKSAGEQFQFNRDVVQVLRIEWNEFIKEYPAIAGTAEQWLKRLADALDPLFTELDAGRDERS